MDKKRSLLNVSVAIIFKILLLAANLLVRRFLIKYIGNEANGLNSLFISLLDFLAVAELGVGSAITFCMYKPIVDGDNDKVSALYRLFTKLYLIIGAVITVCGLAVMPALKYLAKDYGASGINLYLPFGLMLISVVLSYTFSSKTSLINAYKNNYVTTTISSVGTILQCGSQIVVLILTRSFVWYMVCRIGAMAFQWIVTEVIVRIKHGGIINNKQMVDADTKKDVTKNVKAMFMHKIGGLLVNTADSIIISAFIGVVILGKYSNYTTIVISMSGVLALCFSPLTSIIGHMAASEGENEVKKYHNFFHAFNFILGVVFFLGYYAVIDNMVTLFFGADLEMAKSISFVITLNYFIQFMRSATMLFRDATGTFYNDRWKPLAEGALNIALSVLLVLVLPEQYNVAGVIAATIITNIFICHIVEPHVLYKYAFHTGAKEYYIRNYVYIAVFSVALVLLHFCMVHIDNTWLELLANGAISLGISLFVCFGAVLGNKDFRHYARAVFGKLQRNKKEDAR